MKHDPIPSGKRAAIDLSLDTGIVAAARAEGVDLDRVSEEALRRAVFEVGGRRWAEENRAWIAAHNAWIEQHGLPLERYRLI